MSGLKGWGSDPADTRTVVECTHIYTGEKRTFNLSAPIGAEAVKLQSEIMALDAENSGRQLTIIGLRRSCKELAGYDDDTLERLIVLTGGLRSPLAATVLRVLGLDAATKDDGKDGGKDGKDGAADIPFSSSGQD